MVSKDSKELVDETTVSFLNNSLYTRIPASIVRRLQIKPSKKDVIIRTIGKKKVEITFPDGQ